MARKVKKLPVRDGFVIITNGRQSEKNYFEIIRANRKSLYKIDVRYFNDDPEGLINQAINIKNDDNRVWCVFDKDEFPADSIYRAVRRAKQNEIGIAFSNAAFEVWLINHFRKFEAEKNPKELISILDEMLKQYGYSKGYEKNDEKVIKEVFLKRMEEACNNANIIYQRRVVECKHRNVTEYPICDWNSFTTVHLLLEALQISNKE